MTSTFMILSIANLKLARVHFNAEYSIANHAAYPTKYGQLLIKAKIQCFRARTAQPAKEEEAAVDEIPELAK